ncbi:oxygen-insensitive NADPH nitroreductase [Staphylococcus kloosii]|uniref:NADPH-dependent oxidoreductase n=1 Tax=Staphylococcus kloosii TaxID=29384 RepID=A0A151A3Z6_9STAP|nr:oxygen-insensitive NADPH nitroreductase [Staphylococcus kloosii]KYH14076.1 NADPH-dependent oxidoreductase [Staphylococcus kloosii]MBF7023060.1 oxygen-insensitive NADPH nitroreductase [Staphylococcus kloosii]MCD8879079.1 oxygen-insensitive NADPH nitroreductase [Staphylococcus kloosii]PTJ79032.1 oxygen-insensitive NADPH nitroreductase [Staphylococcus kloosii]HJF66997.1 oxygen-insensitive NADPH nitroreductase [Staphylococcus kloosii]
MTNYVYDLMKKHHSVRKFKDKPLSNDEIKKLVEAGQSASSSSYLQTYSIIGVDDPQVKNDLKEVSGQPYVVDNGYLFVFVMDYYRHALIEEDKKSDMDVSIGSTEGLLVGTIDAALVAQNIAVAAEDMGYGIVYLGSLRNDVHRVKEILNLPEHTFPLFGMAVGEPADDENGAPKPRLPFEHIFHENQYNSDEQEQRKALEDYDKTVSDYYHKRTNGERNETWSNQIARALGSKQRLDMLDELNRSGFLKR